MRKILLTITSIVLLVGCTAEQRAKKTITAANFCETADDCVLVGSKCPFGCYIYANENEAARITELVNNFDSNCEYSCVQSFGVECVENTCKAVTTQPPAMEADPTNEAGNVGATCETDADCATPIDYLIRSICPFTSVCREGSCTVVCPMMEHDPEMEISRSWPVSCITSTDCDCGSYVAEDKQRCECINDACYAVVSE